MSEPWQGSLGGPRPTARGVVALDDQHGPALPGQPDRGGEPVRTTADHHRIVAIALGLWAGIGLKRLLGYVGAGGRYGSASLTLVVDGMRASRKQDGFGTNVLGGVRFPRLPGHPFAEVRWGDETWTLTFGVLPRLGSL